jgi:hypothetical protein
VPTIAIVYSFMYAFFYKKKAAEKELILNNTNKNEEDEEVDRLLNIIYRADSEDTASEGKEFYKNHQL